MKRLLLAVLALSILFMGCTDSPDDGALEGDVTDSNVADSGAQVTQDDVMDEIEIAVVDEADDVEIGEMI